MKVLITGAGGFIGSHLVEICIEQDFDVNAFVHYNSRNSWGWLEDSECLNEINIISGDIRDYDSVFNALKGCDAVFHLAALIGIPYSYISPLAYIRTNVEGTYNILQAARELNVGNIMITSTSETYGTAQYIPIDESHPMVGQSPYSASKIAADELAISYARSFKLPVKIIKPFNVYGPRQSARAIIPTIIIQILRGHNKIKLGTLSPTRDFTFVKDTVNGFIEVFKSEKLFGEITNIGMNNEISIGDIAELIAGLLKKKIEIDIEKKRIRPDDSEVIRLKCDNSKISSNTDWKPEYTLEEGIRETIEWFTDPENLKKYKTDIYNV